MEKGMEGVRRVHCVIPESLFEELKRWNILEQIDSVITEQLWKEVQRRKKENERKRQLLV